MKCQKCNSTRVASVYSHSRDCCNIQLNGKDNQHKDYGNGYTPSDMGIGGGDDVEFEYCLDCGQMQGKFPIPKCKMEEENVDNE